MSQDSNAYRVRAFKCFSKAADYALSQLAYTLSYEHCRCALQMCKTLVELRFLERVVKKALADLSTKAAALENGLSFSGGLGRTNSKEGSYEPDPLDKSLTEKTISIAQNITGMKDSGDVVYNMYRKNFNMLLAEISDKIADFKDKAEKGEDANGEWALSYADSRSDEVSTKSDKTTSRKTMTSRFTDKFTFRSSSRDSYQTNGEENEDEEDGGSKEHCIIS